MPRATPLDPPGLPIPAIATSPGSRSMKKHLVAFVIRLPKASIAQHARRIGLTRPTIPRYIPAAKDVSARPSFVCGLSRRIGRFGIGVFSPLKSVERAEKRGEGRERKMNGFVEGHVFDVGDGSACGGMGGCAARGGSFGGPGSEGGSLNECCGWGVLVVVVLDVALVVVVGILFLLSLPLLLFHLEVAIELGPVFIKSTSPIHGQELLQPPVHRLQNHAFRPMNRRRRSHTGQRIHQGRFCEKGKGREAMPRQFRWGRTSRVARGCCDRRHFVILFHGVISTRVLKVQQGIFPKSGIRHECFADDRFRGKRIAAATETAHSGVHAERARLLHCCCCYRCRCCNNETNAPYPLQHHRRQCKRTKANTPYHRGQSGSWPEGGTNCELSNSLCFWVWPLHYWFCPSRCCG